MSLQVELGPLLDYALCLYDAEATLTSCNAEGSGLTVLRALRLARLIRLFRNVPNIRKQLRVLTRTLAPLASLSFLLFVVVIIFTSIGSFVYAGGMTEPVSRANLVLGALVWVWGPTIPKRVTDKYLGWPARLAIVNLTKSERPLGVEILTTFGEGRLIKGRQWVSSEYEQDKGIISRRRRPCVSGPIEVDVEQDRIGSVAACEEEKRWAWGPEGAGAVGGRVVGPGGGGGGGGEGGGGDDGGGSKGGGGMLTVKSKSHVPREAPALEEGEVLEQGKMHLRAEENALQVSKQISIHPSIHPCTYLSIFMRMYVCVYIQHDSGPKPTEIDSD
jgi:uncharacterized membrane protein YgcG